MTSLPLAASAALLLATLAATAAAQPATRPATPSMDQQRAQVLQVLDRRTAGRADDLMMEDGHRYRGAFVDRRTLLPDDRGTAGWFSMALRLYLDPNSELHRDPDLEPKLRAAMDYLLDAQYEDGTIDLGTWRHAPPEVGFILGGMADAHEDLAASDAPLKAELLPKMGQFIEKGAAAVRDGPMYTPNHRWAAGVAPLSNVIRVFGDEHDYMAGLEDYLADGIDLNDEGAWKYEMSPSYNSVANWGLFAAAMNLGRPELLDPVRENLDFMMYFVQPGGEADSSFSRRQDRGLPDRDFGDYVILRAMSILDDDGRYATAADELFERRVKRGGLQIGMHEGLRILRQEQFDTDDVDREPLPTSYAKTFPQTGVTRLREGDFAATLFHDLPPGGADYVETTRGAREAEASLLHLHLGDLVLHAVYLKFDYNLPTLFRPHEFEPLGENRYRLAWHYEGFAFTQEFRREGRQEGRMRADLKAEVILHVDPAAQRVELQLDLDGTRDIPAAVELIFRPAKDLALDGEPIELPKLAWWSDDAARVTAGDDALIVTGGQIEHKLDIGYGNARLNPIGDRQQERQGLRLVATGLTPWQHTVTLQAEPAGR